MSSAVRPSPGTVTDPLRAFVPRLAADWLRDDPGTRARTFEGTLVFADVSSFTELTEKLARRGREGAEEITFVLDAAFAELIGAAYAQNADLLKFGGDAVLLLFRGAEHEQRAASAAWGMQAALSGMRRLSTSAGPVRLQMSIGIHSGAFHLFLVGGVHRELVVAGLDATACVDTEAAAASGEVTLSASTAACLTPELLGATRGGVVVLARDPVLEPVVPPFFDPSGVDLAQLLPAAVTRELRGRPADPEHRHVAVGFVEIGGTDDLLARSGQEALAEALDERISAIQESCRSFDVTFAQTDISKGGVKAILLAGAPRSAGGDEEELMLRVGRAIIESPGRLPVRVGVNAGRVFAGIVGPPLRRTYTFYGDAINTAARIMARAKSGHLLVHEDVVERSRTTYALTELKPFRAKGKEELVRVADVGPPLGEREPESIGPFVGREHELDALFAALQDAREGHGSLVFVTGEPGLGKTRLLGELRARTAGIRTVRAQCAQFSANRPYGAAGAVLRRALQLGPHASAGETELRLRDTVEAAAPALVPWVPLLGAVMGLELAPTPETDALDEQFVSERISDLVESLLGELVPDAALVVVDDVHFMDEASAELFGRIARGIAQRHWLIVVARREWDGGFRSPPDVPLVELQLEPLDRSAAHLLIDQLTEEAPLSRHVSDAVVTRAAGSPLFLTEIVAALRAGADLAALPESVEALLAVQIDHLASADRAVLRQASVLGARFTRSMFNAALEFREDDGEAVLERLREFLVADGEGGVRFRHGLVREAAYHGLSFRRRRELHSTVAVALEQNAGGDADVIAEQLTHHFYQAGAWEKALRYGLLAGLAAQRGYANVDAAALLDRAVSAGRQWRQARPEAVALAAEALGDVRSTLGELDQARAAYRIARRRVAGDAVEQARLMRKEATAAFRLGAYLDARKVLMRGLAGLNDVRSVPATAQRARLEALLGIIAAWQGRPREAVTWYERAIADGEAVGAKKALAHALAGLDLAYNALGEPERAVSSHRALEIYDELGDLVKKGGVLNNLGLLSYYSGSWNEALDYYRRAREAWEQAGDTRSVSMASFNVGEILSAQGRLDEAEPLLREAERASRASGGATDIAESIVETALLDARRGRIDSALQQLAQARRAFEEAGDAQAVLLVDARTAEALALGGELEKAAKLAAEALARSQRDDGAALTRPVLLRVLGQAQLAAGEESSARVVLEQALDEARGVRFRYEEALTLDALARLGAPDLAGLVAIRDGLFKQLGIVSMPSFPVAP